MSYDLTPEEIGNSLANLSLDGSSWLVDNPMREYHEIINDLIFCLNYDIGWDKISSDMIKINELKQWKEEVSTWERILKSNDVAMYPPCLWKVKSMFLIIMDKDYCETINRLSWCSITDFHGLGDLYHRRLVMYKAEYGVFRFRNIIGDNMLKALRKHLNITEEDFEAVYGLSLHEDINSCDEMLVEMLVKGRLNGAIRNYKIENEYY